MAIAEDNILLNRVKQSLNTELVKRMLNKYFAEKGFDNFQRRVYAPMLQDLPYRIPELLNKIEIVPFVKEINPATGQTVMGWNLYVLGTNRMYLGDTSHNNMSEFQRAIAGPTPNSVANDSKNPKEIVDFVLKVLAASKSGQIRPQPQMPLQPSPRAIINRPKMGPTMSGGYYEGNKPAG
jgi:hypothetical protein